jgi:hypothetical protein
MTLTSVTGFPAVGGGDTCQVTLDDGAGNVEVVTATAIAGSVVTITRAQEGTSGFAFADLDPVEIRITALSHTDVLAADLTPALAGPLDLNSSNITGTGDMVTTGQIDLTHTAVAEDDHALELIVDAAGFGDVKALDIDYITGDIAAGEEEAICLINIDETASTGGSVAAFEAVTTAEGSATVYGLLAGAQVAPIEHLSGTFGNADSILNKAVDVLTALSGGGAGNISIFVADNDTITIGDAAKFEELEIVIDTAASGSGVAPTFEYSTGVGTWASFTPTDGTNGFLNTGIVLWLDGDIPSWAVGTGSEYLIRITRTKNSVSTTPIVDLIQIAAIVEYSWDKDANISAKGINLSGSTTMTSIIDDDTMATASATSLATSESIKAYADSVGGGIANVVEDTTPQLGGALDANGQDIKFDNNTGIKDSNNNEQIRFIQTTSAVNHLDVTNSATGNAVGLDTAGGDTNIDLDLGFSGSGGLKINGSAAKIDTILDDDTMAADDATALCTQQSIKSYVDTQEPSHRFNVYRAGAQSITNNTTTKVEVNTEVFDSESYFDPTTNYRFTPTEAGVWVIVGQVAMSGLSTDKLIQIAIRKNGSSNVGIQKHFVVGTTAQYPQIICSTDMNGTTDYLEFTVFQDSGGSLNLTAGEGVTYMMGWRID